MSQYYKYTNDPITPTKDVKRISSDEFRHTLKQMFQAFEHIPLRVCVHHALDPFFPTDLHVDKSHDDQQCFEHTKHKLHVAYNKKMSMPRALLGKNLTIVTLRTYCTTIMFLRAFGASVTDLVNHDYPMTTSIFNNSMLCKIQTYHMLIEFYEAYTLKHSLPFINKIEKYWKNASHVQTRVNDKIDKLRANVAHQKNVTIPFDIYALHTGPLHMSLFFEKGPFYDYDANSSLKKPKSTKHINNDDPSNPNSHSRGRKSSPKQVKNKKKSHEIATSTNKQQSNVESLDTNRETLPAIADDTHKNKIENTNKIDYDPYAEEKAEAIEYFKNCDNTSYPVIDTDEVNTVTSDVWTKLVPSRTDILVQMKPPFAITDITTCDPDIIVDYVLGILYPFDFEIKEHLSLTNDELEKTEYTRAHADLKSFAIEAMYALIRSAKEEQLRSQFQCVAKAVFIDLNILPIHANNIVDARYKHDPHRTLHCIFPFDENLGDEDGLIPLDISCVPRLRNPRKSYDPTEPLYAIPLPNSIAKDRKRMIPHLATKIQINNNTIESDTTSSRHTPIKIPSMFSADRVKNKQGKHTPTPHKPTNSVLQSGMNFSFPTRIANATTAIASAFGFTHNDKAKDSILLDNKSLHSHSSHSSHSSRSSKRTHRSKRSHQSNRTKHSNSHTNSIDPMKLSFSGPRHVNLTHKRKKRYKKVNRTPRSSDSQQEIAISPMNPEQEKSSQNPQALLTKMQLDLHNNALQMKQMEKQFQDKIHRFESILKDKDNKIKHLERELSHSRSNSLNTRLSDASSSHSTTVEHSPFYVFQDAIDHKSQNEYKSDDKRSKRSKHSKHSKRTNQRSEGNVNSHNRHFTRPRHFDSDSNDSHSSKHSRSTNRSNKHHKRGNKNRKYHPKRGKHNSKNKRSHRHYEHFNEASSDSSTDNDTYARHLEYKALIQAQAKEKIKIGMDNVKNSFTAQFHGFPNNHTNSEQTIQLVCNQAIAFVINVLMWFAMSVKPNKTVYSEQMAIGKVVTHLRSQAKTHFQMYETGNHIKITTLHQFIMYLLKHYIKHHNLNALKQAILSEMPSDLEVKQSITGAFKPNKLISGLFNEIINLARAEQYITSASQYNDLIITDDDLFSHMYYFLDQIGIVNKIDQQLTNQPIHIKQPTNLADLETALLLLETKQDDRAKVKSRLKAKNIVIKRRSGHSDPTTTVAGKNVHQANFGRFNQSNRGKNKNHSYKHNNNNNRYNQGNRNNNYNYTNNNKYNKFKNNSPFYNNKSYNNNKNNQYNPYYKNNNYRGGYRGNNRNRSHRSRYNKHNNNNRAHRSNYPNSRNKNKRRQQHNGRRNQHSQHRGKPKWRQHQSHHTTQHNNDQSNTNNNQQSRVKQDQSYAQAANNNNTSHHNGKLPPKRQNSHQTHKKAHHTNTHKNQRGQGKPSSGQQRPQQQRPNRTYLATHCAIKVENSDFEYDSQDSISSYSYASPTPCVYMLH